MTTTTTTATNTTANAIAIKKNMQQKKSQEKNRKRKERATTGRTITNTKIHQPKITAYPSTIFFHGLVPCILGMVQKLLALWAQSRPES